MTCRDSARTAQETLCALIKKLSVNAGWKGMATF